MDKYEELDLEIINFEAADIIITSEPPLDLPDIDV